MNYDTLKSIFSSSQIQLFGKEAKERIYDGKEKKWLNSRHRAHLPRECAVSLSIINDDNVPKILFIERPIYKGSHSGQIAFPGGKRETEDKTLLETARRETKEEVNISLHQPYKELTSIYIPVSHFKVAPYLFFVDEMPHIIPEEREVASYFMVSISDILDDQYFMKSLVIPSNSKSQSTVEVNSFVYEGHIIWGATALMLQEFKFIVNSIV